MAVSSETPVQAISDVLAAALSTASEDGGPARVNWNPCPKLRSILTMSQAFLGSKSKLEVPFFPARSVLPDLCT